MMGSKKEINFILKSSVPLEDLAEGQERFFEKRGEIERVYITNFPILLADPEWNVLAAIEISEYTESGHKTTGKYRVIKMLDEEQKSVLTGLYRELYSK